MLSFLKNHPFAVNAFFDSSMVLAFAVPKEQLQSRIPPCCTPDTHDAQWGFIAIAMVTTRHLRPKGFPTFMGNDFFLIGYRIFVRYTDERGKRLRGLYILKSETNKKKMEYLGNIFTHYQYTTTDIHLEQKAENIHISSQKSAFEVTLNHEKQEVALPEGSPFPDWKTARRFAGPLPFTFTYQPKKNKVLIIEGVRQNWKPRPIEVQSYHFQFLNSLGVDAQLANAFIIENIPYSWKKGKLETWKP